MQNKKEKHFAWNDLLKTFVATTISIMLTFGTASLIDRHKQAKEKRQIVLMTMYDLNNSLNQARHCDSLIQEFVELQTQVFENPDVFGSSLLTLVKSVPLMHYTETIENIFSSNIETIHTLSNVYFVEKASEFYQLRKKYNDNVKSFGESYDTFMESLSFEGLLAFNSCRYFVISSYLLVEMEHLYLQCKQIMKVSDEELETFYQERQRIEAESGEKEDVWQTKIPQVRNPWLKALEKSQERSAQHDVARP
ncbi:MAG: hypothetical protein J6W30_03580 [Bacteroidales bacterium]|nr:hypothetical protein [Bacteroidales bacterium]